jgi:hypothetical protein
MREHRAAATTAGVLYIAGTAVGVVSMVVVSAPVRVRATRWPMPRSTPTQR